MTPTPANLLIGFLILFVAWGLIAWMEMTNPDRGKK